METDTIQLNGQPHVLANGTASVPDFIKSLDLGDIPVLVELNGEAILAREFDQHQIRPGDVVEIVRMVAGG